MNGARLIALAALVGIATSGCMHSRNPQIAVSGTKPNETQAIQQIVRTNAALGSQSHEDECRWILERAVQAYKAFAFREVIRCGEQVIASEYATREEVIVALSLSGASAYLLGDNRLAEDYFLEALGLNSCLRLDPSVYPVGMVQFFEVVKKQR